jgi:hypothetical protein
MDAEGIKNRMFPLLRSALISKTATSTTSLPSSCINTDSAELFHKRI